ncbi:MAG TPA: hypothetical protein VN901_03700, partial [Candidatus Acidoferrales bacterium]|nr:hypothetical protein [Candidatus Acidoferrales bacterium]
MASEETFRGNKSAKSAMAWWLPFAFAIVVGCAQGVAFAQTKPERQSKAVKPTQSAPSSTENPSSENSPSDKDSGKPEDKLFKGLKYRMIGPFQGGRSLTAAGIPG